MPKVPSMSSNELVRLLVKGGAAFVRQGKTDHAIYARIDRGRKIFRSCPDGKEDVRSNIL